MVDLSKSFSAELADNRSENSIGDITLVDKGISVVHVDESFYWFACRSSHSSDQLLRLTQIVWDISAEGCANCTSLSLSVLLCSENIHVTPT